MAVMAVSPEVIGHPEDQKEKLSDMNDTHVI